MTKKVLLLIAVGVVLVIIGLGVVLTVGFNSETLGRTLLAKASEATGVRLSADEFNLGIFRGLEMAGVTAEGEYSGGSYQLELKRLVFKHRLWPLFSGTLAVDRIVLDQPRVTLLTRAAGDGKELKRPPAQPASLEIGGLQLEVAEISLRDGHILLQTEARAGAPKNRITVAGLNLILSNIVFDSGPASPVQRLSGRGTLAAEQVLLGSLPIRNLEGQVSAGGGILDVTELTLSMDQGDLRATLRTDFNPVPFRYEFSAQGDPININEIVGLSDAGSLGPGRLDLKGHGKGPESRSLRAEGVLHLEEGQIPSHPILEQTQSVLGIQNVVGSEYETTDARFTVLNNRVDLEGFSLETAPAGLDIGGWLTWRVGCECRSVSGLKERACRFPDFPRPCSIPLRMKRGG